jgi:glutamate synthase domain-containing protein 1
MAKAIVSSWESEGYGHHSYIYEQIHPQYLKIRKICEQLGIDIPEMDTQITSLSTRTEIIADELVLDRIEQIYYSDADGFSPDYNTYIHLFHDRFS